MIRVLIAEDSITTRKLLVEILGSDAEIEVVGEAGNGIEAVEMTRQLRPDVVTMDIHMPLMDGFEATRRIMVATPTPIVIVSASHDAREVAFSMHALQAGALTLLAKPAGPDAQDFEQQARRFINTVKAMSQVKVVRRWPERARIELPTAPTMSQNAVKPLVVAIAASTGGPAALAKILSELPGDFPLPVLVVQHIGEGFVHGFTEWLNLNAALPVKVAEDGEPLCRGTVYVAPDGRHLGVKNRLTIMTSTEPPAGGFRPSATFLFDSVAAVFGSSAIGVILTGMGQDGLPGLRAIRKAGGRIFAQDEDSCVVFGMPGAVIAEGLEDAALPPEKLALKLRELLLDNNE